MPAQREPRRKYNYSEATLNAQVPCPMCKKTFKSQGFKKHEASCRAQHDARKDAVRAKRRYKKALDDQSRSDTQRRDRARKKAAAASVEHNITDVQPLEDDEGAPADFESTFHDVPRSPSSSMAMSIQNSIDIQQIPDVPDDNAQIPDFKTEYHPRSKRPTLFQTCDEFRTHQSSNPPRDPAPWRPFRCKGDFEFAEFALDASLNERQVEILLDLISRVANGEAQVTFTNEAELRKHCDWAADSLTPFVEETLTTTYKKDDVSFQFHAKNLWQWALDLLNNPHLAPYFVWDAERLYKRNGEQFERFYDEPWTAERWWDVQSALPPVENAVPFAFILYADKSKLSSFGTVKGYPIIAHCANLPTHIRNSKDVGGGAVVGWLPVLPEDAEEEGKLGYTTLKRVIWHESFLKLLDEVALHAKTGFVHVCHDKIERCLFPLILILSADYEEQCMMSLIRGRLGKCPCPICLVPLNELHDLTKSFPPRLQEQAEAAYKVWLEDRRKGDEMLKKLGLRPVSNAFWLVSFSDPHLALSFDILHSLHLGLFGKHIFEEIKKILKFLGRDNQAAVERYIASFPSWRQLTHFSTVIHITFNDGNKMCDLAKQVFYSLLLIFNKNVIAEGYALLKMLKCYLELDCLIGLDVHMQRTIGMIESELLQFNDALQEYIELATKSDVPGLKLDWDFPKAHLWKHATRDIRSKGAARNYSTRPNESMHGALRHAYERRTNRRHVAAQILCVDHHVLALKLLRQAIDYQSPDFLDNEEIACQSNLNLAKSSSVDANRGLDAESWSLGSPCKPQLMQIFETNAGSTTKDGSFTGLRKKFTEFLNSAAPGWGYKHKTYIKIPPDFEITEHRYLKIKYGSTVDWRETTDHLRCNPSFYGKPRYDCALVQFTSTTVAFVRLNLIFTCHVPELADLGISDAFALVQPFSKKTGVPRWVDRDLNLIRVKALPPSSSSFIPVASIIRGAVLAPDPEKEDEFLVFTYLDDDMFLRFKSSELDTAISGP